jgi:uncharacterized protein
MFKKFLPKRDIFFAFFEKHVSISFQAAEQLLLFIDHHSNHQEIFQTIKKLENEADSVTHQCIEALHRTFITPMDRMDIHRLISTLDNIADEIEDIAKMLFLYKLEVLRPEAAQLAQIVVRSVREVCSAVKELRKMKITPTLQKHFYNINHLENEADALFNEALSKLFDEEIDTKALIKWKEVYEHLENATDVCEDVSNILEGIILENE